MLDFNGPALIPYWQVAAAWVTVNVRPAIVNVPVLALFVELAATLYGTLPLPVPELTMIEIQLALLFAVQAAFTDGAMTPTLPFPPATPKLADAGVSEKVVAAAASWLTLNVSPAMVTVPVRAVVAVFAATV